MADNNKPTPTTSPNSSPVYPKSRTKFTVRRLTQNQVNALGETDVFRAYSVYGMVSAPWETATVKVSALHLDRRFNLMLRWPDKNGPLTADVRLAFEPRVMRLLDYNGQTTYSRIHANAFGHKGIVYLPLHDAGDSKALMHIAANPMRLGGWALQRLRPLIIEWADKHL